MQFPAFHSLIANSFHESFSRQFAAQVLRHLCRDNTATFSHRNEALATLRQLEYEKCTSSPPNKIQIVTNRRPNVPDYMQIPLLFSWTIDFPAEIQKTLPANRPFLAFLRTILKRNKKWSASPNQERTSTIQPLQKQNAWPLFLGRKVCKTPDALHRFRQATAV